MADINPNPVIEKVWKDLIKMTVSVLRDTVRREGITASGSLLASIEEGAVDASKGWIEGSVYYDALLRIKDMKTLHYTSIPPLAPIMEWVESQGINKFPFVPGYPNGVKKANETSTIMRIAEGIRWNLKAYPNVRRNHRGVYNDPLKEIILPEFWIAMRGFAISYTTASLHESFGITPINLEERVLNFQSEGRMQAGANSRETKLERKLPYYTADRSYKNEDLID